MIKSQTYVNRLLEDIRENTRLAACGSATTTPEFDVFTLCNPVDGSVVVASVTYSITGVPTTTYYLPTGALYVGPTPVNCPGTTIEADPVQGCGDGVAAIQWIVKIDGTPTGTIYYTDVLGAVIAAPPGFTFGPCNAADQVFQRCLCDDVAGNGSNIVRYIEFYTYDPLTNQISVTGTWLSDLSATYVPVNPIDCDQIGTDPIVVQRKVTLTGIQAWIRPATVLALSIRIRRVGDVLNPPTSTDNAAVTTPFFLGDQDDYSVMGTSYPFLQGTFSVNLNHANDIISIHYLEQI